MSIGIEEILRPLLRERSTRFVFPSEICAESWLAASLRAGGGPTSQGEGPGALEADRFLGWDRLKEKAAIDDARPPADDGLRRIFAASLLASNAGQPFLRSVLSPAYAGQWQPFAGYVASRLPALGRLPAALQASPGATRRATSDPIVADWLAIRERYAAFLVGIGRFEPSYEPRSLGALGGKTIIFFPELIEDFEEYRTAFGRSLGTGGSVRAVSLPGGSVRARLGRPETALAEIRQTFSEVGDLLDRGAEPESIAITVPGLDRYRPYLEREAALQSIPLTLRSGSSLAATPGGRLFAALRDAHASGYAFDSLRDLIMSPAWPWKEPERGRAIIAEGQRLHAVASWREGGKVRDVWELSLRDGLRREYRRLKDRIGAVVSAGDFKSLLKAYNAFKGEFLSKERGEWDSLADATLARCIVELEALVQAEAASGLEVPGAFGLFMRGLESRRYVSAGGAAGVPVYEWRVAAGVRADRHFVLHASQDALSVPSRVFDYLGEAARDDLRAGAAPDSAPAFIRAYALSGASVSFSCPDAGFGGAEAAHGFLVSMSSPDAAETKVDRSYRAEAAWLAGRGDPPARLHLVQALGLAAAAAAPAFSPSEGAFLEPDPAALAAARLSRRRRSPADPYASRPSIDSTAIDYYHSCAYSYLYLRLLDASPQASGISFVDALFIGDVYHHALARLFERIREADGRFRPERAGDYRSFVGSCLDDAFAELARKRGPFVGVVLEAYRGRLQSYLENLVDAEASLFPGLEIGPLEEEFELAYPDLEGGVVLRGRIDRISLSDKGAVVVDYKKGRLPAKSQVAPDEDGAIAEAQIPCYLRLAAANGERLGERVRGAGAVVDSAWYLSIEGDARREAGSAACAFGDETGAAVPPDRAGQPASTAAARRGPRAGRDEPYVSRSSLQGFLDSFDSALRSTVEGIFAGAFPLASKESQKLACTNCGARGICRERYALRFGASPSGGAAPSQPISPGGGR